jgi:prophage regulatory protein
MAQQLRASLTILRRKQVEAETGYSRSTIYLRISQGLFIRPVRLGARAVGFPAGEIAALNAARIAGNTDTDIRVLVAKLQAARSAALTVWGAAP